MSDDSAARITAELATYIEAKTRQAEAAARAHTDSKNKEVLSAYDRKLVAAHELANVVAAEWSSVLARLAAAEAMIAAYKTLQAAQYKSNDYYAATATLEAALAAYDALASTGKGTG